MEGPSDGPGRDDEYAMVEIWRRHRGAVFRVACGLCGPHRAEEVAQEVYLALWGGPQRYDPQRGSVRSYLLAQAHGRAIDVLRSDNARLARERGTSVGTINRCDVEREALARITGERVLGALAVLSDTKRQAIALAFFGGHTYREIAVLTHQPEGTIKSRIRAGLAELRAELGCGDLS